MLPVFLVVAFWFVGVSCSNGWEEIKSLSEVCGVSGSRTLVGLEWPWMTILLYHNHMVCGGTLITLRHIVTAAHCVADNPPYAARFGVTDRFSHGVDVRIKKVTINKEYNKLMILKDIALATLDRSVTMTDKIKPICLPHPTYGSDDSLNGRLAVVTGYGKPKFDQPVTGYLKAITLPVVSSAECRMSYVNRIDEHVICAGKGKKSVCHGDSGGPLMTLENGQYFLAAVVSYGVECERLGIPGVFQRTGAYLQWIVNVISRD